MDTEKRQKEMIKELYAELAKTTKGASVAVLSGLPGNDAVMDVKQLRALAVCLVKVADALDAGGCGELEQQYTCDFLPSADLID